MLYERTVKLNESVWKLNQVFEVFFPFKAKNVIQIEHSDFVVLRVSAAHLFLFERQWAKHDRH